MNINLLKKILDKVDSSTFRKLLLSGRDFHIYTTREYNCKKYESKKLEQFILDENKDAIDYHCHKLGKKIIPFILDLAGIYGKKDITDYIQSKYQNRYDSSTVYIDYYEIMYGIKFNLSMLSPNMQTKIKEYGKPSDKKCLKRYLKDIGKYDKLILTESISFNINGEQNIFLGLRDTYWQDAPLEDYEFEKYFIESNNDTIRSIDLANLRGTSNSIRLCEEILTNIHKRLENQIDTIYLTEIMDHLDIGNISMDWNVELKLGLNSYFCNGCDQDLDKRWSCIECKKIIYDGYYGFDYCDNCYNTLEHEHKLVEKTMNYHLTILEDLK